MCSCLETRLDAVAAAASLGAHTDDIYIYNICALCVLIEAATCVLSSMERRGMRTIDDLSLGQGREGWTLENKRYATKIGAVAILFCSLALCFAPISGGERLNTGRGGEPHHTPLRSALTAEATRSKDATRGSWQFSFTWLPQLCVIGGPLAFRVFGSEDLCGPCPGREDRHMVPGEGVVHVPKLSL